MMPLNSSWVFGTAVCSKGYGFFFNLTDHSRFYETQIFGDIDDKFHSLKVYQLTFLDPNWLID